MDEPTETIQQKHPSGLSESPGLPGCVFVAGLIPVCFLLLVFLSEQIRIKNGGKGIDFGEGMMIGFVCMGFTFMQLMSIATGLTYILKFSNWKSHLRGSVFTTIGMALGLIFIAMILVPNYLEKRARHRLPREYRMEWPFVEGMLKDYKIQHGEYPPLLMPYLKPDLDLENQTPFPNDAYHKPEVERYWYDQLSKRWSHIGKLMKENPTSDDFDFTGYYRYYSDGKGFIMIGNGPDCDADLDTKESFLTARGGDTKKLVENKYDPTNGTDSGGDYYVLKLR